MTTQYRCPRCSRTVYNRRLKACEFCGFELPASLLFSADELAESEQREVEAKERAEAAIQRDEEAKRKASTQIFFLVPIAVLFP